MRLLRQLKAFILCLTLVLGTMVPAALIALPFGLRTRLKIVIPVWKFFSFAVLRFGVEAKIAIAEDRRSEEYKNFFPPRGLHVANHQSYIDIPLLITMTQPPPIMKKEVMYIPIIGWMGYVSGAMPVSRDKQNSRKRVFMAAKKRLVTEQIGLQVYPEGTRSKTAHPKPFEEIKASLLQLAYKENVPLTAISMYGTRGILDKNGFITPGKKVGIILHKEIYPKDYETSEAFARAGWNLVTTGYEELRTRLAGT